MTPEHAKLLWCWYFCAAYKAGQTDARRAIAFRHMDALERRYPAIVPTEQERFSARVGLAERKAQAREAASV